MRLLDLTLTTPAENLALDAALLEAAEDADHPCEVLRLWESPQPVVIVGRSSRVAQEVDEAACRHRGIPILRRCSGGAAVVVGPGCLMYAVVLSYALRPACQLIAEAHRVVLGRLTESLRPLIPAVQAAGTSDLTVGDRKFSGNSLRCQRTHLLYHGTLLYGFPLELVAACLQTPPRQPGYREGRAHAAFVTNLALSAEDLRQALIVGWQASETYQPWPRERTAQLVQARYGQSAWNRRL
jgi:lipoate-protein ligase A